MDLKSGRCGPELVAVARAAAGRQSAVPLRGNLKLDVYLARRGVLLVKRSQFENSALEVFGADFLQAFATHVEGRLPVTSSTVDDEFQSCIRKLRKGIDPQGFENVMALRCALRTTAGSPPNTFVSHVNALDILPPPTRVISLLDHDNNSVAQMCLVNNSFRLVIPTLMSQLSWSKNFALKPFDVPWLLRETDITEQFTKYTSKTLDTIRVPPGAGCRLETHSNEILSLASILALREEQHSAAQVEAFGLRTLAQLLEDEKELGLPELSAEETSAIKAFVRQLRDFFEDNELSLTGSVLEEQVFRMKVSQGVMRCAFNDDAEGAVSVFFHRLAGILASWVETLPKHKLTPAQGELEAMESVSWAKRLFSFPSAYMIEWSNTLRGANSNGAAGLSTSKRPDGEGSYIKQRCRVQIGSTFEVKPESESDNLFLLNLDCVRLGLFGRRAIDTGCEKGFMLNHVSFQSIGPLLIIFNMRRHPSGIYPMIELGWFKTPSSLEEIVGFLRLDKILLLFRTYKMKLSQAETGSNSILDGNGCAMSIADRRPSIATPALKRIIDHSKDRRRECNIRYR
ncbi:hypothetical protein BC832DRAFT_616212 [Gaertneriomyces semiglobifer]|nr:hypothetical protein BC832DRAFT_616212 [Gaertneriomyces semiglobifer]